MGSWLKVYGHRVVGVLVCVLVVGGVVAGGVWSWCAAQRRRVARENAVLVSEMIEEFPSRNTPFIKVPEGFGVESDPSRWPEDPIDAGKVEATQRAVSYYDLRYPARAVTVDSLRRAYGRDFARNIRTRRDDGSWVYDVKEYEFIAWCRKPADLVYKEDCFDQIDGKYHKAGEEVRASISNYQYVTNAYTVYTFAWDVR
ncbi:hypothetical protein [Scardovia wiggsiae]|uniref:hypothetical protein n=1 Tax=Scardovia wiggsiae TaxID=230143 RepID=UPI00374EEAA9